MSSQGVVLSRKTVEVWAEVAGTTNGASDWYRNKWVELGGLLKSDLARAAQPDQAEPPDHSAGFYCPQCGKADATAWEPDDHNLRRCTRCCVEWRAREYTPLEGLDEQPTPHVTVTRQTAERGVVEWNRHPLYRVTLRTDDQRPIAEMIRAHVRGEQGYNDFLLALAGDLESVRARECEDAEPVAGADPVAGAGEGETEPALPPVGWARRSTQPTPTPEGECPHFCASTYCRLFVMGSQGRLCAYGSSAERASCGIRALASERDALRERAEDRDYWMGRCKSAETQRGEQYIRAEKAETALRETRTLLRQTDEARNGLAEGDEPAAGSGACDDLGLEEGRGSLLKLSGPAHKAARTIARQARAHGASLVS